jgi:3-hydroxyacyl-CoA dehydrogenase
MSYRMSRDQEPVSMLVTRRDRGSIRIIETNNPPVNALSQAVRESLTRELAAADSDLNIRAVILICGGRGFHAGADIREIGKPRLPPRVFELTHQIDAMRKPVVAAIHGNALGGGLEMALACHWRVAAADTKLGLPEVKLGLIPGAGGTQKLPRLIGIEKAVDMIVSGRICLLPEALTSGLIDAKAEGDLESFASDFIGAVLEKLGAKAVRKYDEAPLLSPGPDYFAELRKTEKQRARGQKSPLACIEAIERTTSGTLAEGLKREREIFVAMEGDEQSAALRHLFFAERRATSAPETGTGNTRPIAKAAVAGGGTMGTGIAMALANAGIAVAITDSSPEALQRGMSAIARTYEDAVKRSRVTEAEGHARRSRITASPGIAEAAADADIVIEAVIEDLAVKQSLFAILDQTASASAILASNTSTLDVDVIAQATKDPSRVLGMHFFSPAHIMRLVEVVRAEKTSPGALATVVDLAKRIGKIPVVVGVCDGFVGNRMLAERTREAERLLAMGALPHDVDKAVTDFGFPMGPFAMSDLAGLDVGWRIRQARGTSLEIADTLYDMSRYGQKTGRGYYLYESGSRSPVRDPEVEAIITQVARRNNAAGRTFTPDEIIERLFYPLINEGARILEEGIAARSSDIDVIWVHGYGWPAWRGGPMYYAGRIGLAGVRDRLAKLHDEFGHPSLRPAALLNHLADQNMTFEQEGA